jgi:hypothetical protein
MTEKPKKSSLKFWLIFGAINVAVYVVGYHLLTQIICDPPSDAAFCKKAIQLWPGVILLPVPLLAIQKMKIALREINAYKAQRSKWGNWKPPH